MRCLCLVPADIAEQPSTAVKEYNGRRSVAGLVVGRAEHMKAKLCVADRLVNEGLRPVDVQGLRIRRLTGRAAEIFRRGERRHAAEPRSRDYAKNRSPKSATHALSPFGVRQDNAQRAGSQPNLVRKASLRRLVSSAQYSVFGNFVGSSRPNQISVKPCGAPG